MSKNVGIIIGSSRPSRIGANVTDWARSKLPKSDDVVYELIDLKVEDLPLLDEIMPPMMGQYHNEHTKRWAKKVAGLDAFVVVSPEYNAGYPAVLKNAIDYLKAEWQNKPIAIITYGYSGGASANNQLKEVFTRIGTKITATSPLLTFAQNDFGPDFQIKDLEATFGASSADITKAGEELIALLQ